MKWRKPDDTEGLYEDNTFIVLVQGRSRVPATYYEVAQGAVIFIGDRGKIHHWEDILAWRYRTEGDTPEWLR